MTRKEQYQALVREQMDFMKTTVKERKAADPSYTFATDESYVKRDAEISTLLIEIQEEKKMEERERAFDHQIETRSHGRSTSAGDATEVAVRNLVNYMTTGDSRLATQSRANLASNGTTTFGYLVPTFISDAVIKGLAPFESVRRAGAQVIQVEGNTNVPIINDATANYIQEAQSVTATDPTTGRVVITPNLLIGKTTFSWQLANRSVTNIVDQLVESFTNGIGTAESNKFLLGTGTNQPQGVTVGGTAFNAADDTTFTGDELISMYHTLDPRYAVNGTWLMSPSAASMARGLQSSNGALLWYPNLTTGTETLFGRPVIIDPTLPAIGASAVGPIVFGDFSQYVIGEETSFEIKAQDLLDTGETKIALFKFNDGRVKRAAAFNVMTMHA